MAFIQANTFVDYMVSNGYATETPINWSDNTAGGAQVGDVIAYNLDGGGIDHLAIVTSLDANGYPTVAQSTDNVEQFWSWSTGSNNWIQFADPGSSALLIHFLK